MINMLKKMFGTRVDFKALKDNGAVIIDVRTPAEYAQGHIKGSKNIPLDKIKNSIGKIESMKKPVITCCASGMRSGVAATQLKSRGIEAHNGGGWASLKRKI